MIDYNWFNYNNNTVNFNFDQISDFMSAAEALTVRLEVQEVPEVTEPLEQRPITQLNHYIQVNSLLNLNQFEPSQTPKIWTFDFADTFLSGFQMVSSCGWANHLNTGHLDHKRYMFFSFLSTIWKAKRLTAGHVWIIWKPDLSFIQMVTVLDSNSFQPKF